MTTQFGPPCSSICSDVLFRTHYCNVDEPKQELKLNSLHHPNKYNVKDMWSGFGTFALDVDEM